MSACSMFGRTDGFAYDALVNSLYPVGYSVHWSSALANVSNSATIYTTATPVLPHGVWLISVSQLFNKGTGTFATNSISNIGIRLGTGTGTIMGNNSQYLIPSTASYAAYRFSSITYTFISTSASSQIQVSEYIILATVGTAQTSLDVYFTKIA